MRVIVTGSREWSRKYPIAHRIEELIREHGDELTIVHGDCPDGADAIANSYAVMREVDVQRWPVTREEWAAFGRAAGPKRNERMVNAGADLCLAFVVSCSRRACAGQPTHGSHGATGCANLAVAAGIKTDIERMTRI